MILRQGNAWAEIQPLGAELKQLVVGREVMWCGDAQYWGKTSPVLFPMVGALKEGNYVWEGKTYALPRHGFAREKVFQVIEQEAHRAVFRLDSSAETLAVYPFAFRLDIEYVLGEEGLRCTYQVHNPADQALYFSLGAHPAFAISTEELAYNDYYLEFEQDSYLEVYPLEQGAIATEAYRLPLRENALGLSYALFAQDALVMKSLKSQRIALKNKKNSQGLYFDFEGYPYFGIWAAQNADFVCLEPWCGIADAVDAGKDWKTKEGINVLEPKQTWSRSWTVTVF